MAIHRLDVQDMKDAFIRPIKLKLWDKENNCFYSPTHEAYRGKLEDVFLNLNGDLVMRTLEGMVHESIFPDRFVKIQYTGMDDKNGQEIYEGYLIRSSSHKPSIYIIRFIEGGFCAWHPHLDGFPLDINHFYPSIGTNIEVVGTIFQHPELLRE